MWDIVLEKAKGLGGKVNKMKVIWEISQLSQENTWSGVSFLIKAKDLHFHLKRDSSTYCFCKFYDVCKNTFFGE